MDKWNDLIREAHKCFPTISKEEPYSKVKFLELTPECCEKLPGIKSKLKQCLNEATNPKACDAIEKCIKEIDIWL